MTVMVESDEDSGPPSVAEHEPGPTLSSFLITCRYAAALSRSLFMSIISICSLLFMLMTVSRPRLHRFFRSLHPVRLIHHA